MPGLYDWILNSLQVDQSPAASQLPAYPVQNQGSPLAGMMNPQMLSMLMPSVMGGNQNSASSSIPPTLRSLMIMNMIKNGSFGNAGGMI